MKIGLYALWNLEWDGSRLRGLGCHIRYLRHYLEMTDGVRLFTNLSPVGADTNMDELQDARLEVVELPWSGFTSMWTNLPAVRRLFRANLDGLDSMYVRLFDPCSWVLASACENRKIGLVFHVVGNPIAGIYQRTDWTRWGKAWRHGLFLPEEILTRRAANRHHTLINGGRTVEWFRRRGWHGETVISSTLEPGDFFPREDTCQSELNRVLFVGFLRPWKRVDLLLQAFAMLVQDGRSIELRIVGCAEPMSYGEDLRNMAAELGVADRVSFAGHVSMGEGLNTEYRAADIFCFPSTDSEGSPRALLEAAGNGLPCVMTDMGSARDLFQDGESGIIVPQGDPVAIADGIRRLLVDHDLRRRCVQQSLAIARAHTGRTFIARMVSELELAAGEAKEDAGGS